jgi:hypothetical protein
MTATRRAQGPLALGFVAALALAGIGAERIGSAEPAPASAPAIRSSIWICPHGGAEDWSGSVVVMNPGEADVDVRISTFGRSNRATTVEATVPAAGQLVQEVPVTDRGAATVVDAFDGWVGVAWLVTSDTSAGLGAEPCAPSGERRLLAGDAGTPEGDDAYLVIANPYDADAIVDVALYTADRPPIRPREWSDLRIAPRRSIALPVNRAAEGEDAVLADVTVQVGRVGVASYVLGGDGGIRSALATPAITDGPQELPVAGGSGPGLLSIGVPSETEARFDATLLTREPPQPAGGLTDGEQTGPSARPYAVAADGPSSIHLEVDQGGAVVATLRVQGRASDDGATAAALAPASSWVVPSTVLGDPSFPAVVLVNPGSRDASVTLMHLPEGGGAPGGEERLAVPAGAAVSVPTDFLSADPGAAVLVRADGGDVVALGASASLGVEGFARYALVLGIPLPESA